MDGRQRRGKHLMALVLRPYQDESIRELFQALNEGVLAPLIVLPTGAGKSLVIAEICRRIAQRFPDRKIGVVTHVQELVEQNAMELAGLWNGSIGMFASGLGRKDLGRQVTFMSIQTAVLNFKLLKKFDVIIVDEAHLIPRSSTTRYGKFIKHYRNIVEDMPVIGLTATPFRTDSGMLVGDEDSLFQEIVYEAFVPDLIRAGYLSKIKSKAAENELDTAGLHTRAGEFIESEQAERAMRPGVVDASCEEFAAYGREQDRKGWLVFAINVAHAEAITAKMQSLGVSVGMITGAMDKGARKRMIARYKARQILCLVSVGVLTTGFNAPHVDLIGIMRATQSAGLYVQIVGRGFRLSPGKEDCLVLDYGGNVDRHGPIDKVRPKRRKKPGIGHNGGPELDEDTVRVKRCPNCRTHNEMAARHCIECDFEFPAPPPQISAKAATTPILSEDEDEKPKENPLKWFDIAMVEIGRSRRRFQAEAPQTMRVDLSTADMDTFTVWLPFDSPKHAARRFAQQRWRELGGQNPTPETVEDAWERKGELRFVTRALVDTADKYKSVKLMRVDHERPATEEDDSHDDHGEPWIEHVDAF
jgi:DNA repair protein RadD